MTVKPRIVVSFLEKMKPVLKEALIEISQKVLGWVDEQVKNFDPDKFFESIKNQFMTASGQNVGSNIDVKIFEEKFLEKNTLVKIAKDNIAKGANQVVAYRPNSSSSDYYYIYLAYAKDRELLPQEENVYVIIRSKGIDKAIENLFDGKELIILI